VLGVDRLAGFLFDELLTQPIAGGLVDCRNAMCSALEQAACSAIGQETRASLR
jgi:hypothetical protein